MALNTSKIQISGDMARTFRRGSLLKCLFDELPREDQKKLGQLAGASVPKRSQGSAQVLRRHYLAACSKNSGMIEAGARLWFIKNLALGGSLLPVSPPSCVRTEMVFCLMASLAVSRPRLATKLSSWILDALEDGDEYDWETCSDPRKDAVREWYAHAKVVVGYSELKAQTHRLGELIDPVRSALTGDQAAREFLQTAVAAFLIERAAAGTLVSRSNLTQTIHYLNSAIAEIDGNSTLGQDVIDVLQADPGALEYPELEVRLREISEWFVDVRSIAQSARQYEYDEEADGGVFDLAHELILAVDLPPRDEFLLELVERLRADPGSATDDERALISGLVEYSRAGEETSSGVIRHLESNLVKSTLDQVRMYSFEPQPDPPNLDPPAAAAEMESGPLVADGVTTGSPTEGDEGEIEVDPGDREPAAEQDDTGDASEIVEECIDQGPAETSGPETSDEIEDPQVGPSEETAIEVGLAARYLQSITDLVLARRFLPAILVAEYGAYCSPALNWALRAIHHGTGFRTGDIDDFRGLQNLESVAFEPQQDAGAALLAVAGLIRPTLMASNLYCVAALQEAQKVLAGSPAVSEFISGLIDFAIMPQRLDGDALVGLDIRNQLSEKKSRLERETEQWRTNSPKRKNKFPMATRVWQQLVSEKGELTRLIEASQAGSISVEQWEEEEFAWTDLKTVRKKIDNARKSTPGLTRSSQTIDFGAQETMIRQIKEACDLAGRWVRWHHERDHAIQRGPVADSTILDPLIPLAQRVVDDLRSATDDRTLQAAATDVLVEKCAELVNRFEVPERRLHFSDDIRDPEFFVYAVPEVDPEEPGRDQDVLLQVAHRWKDGRPTLAAVAAEQIELGRIRACRYLSERLERPEDLPTDDQIQEASRKACLECRKQIDRTVELIQRYEIEGALSEDDVGVKSRMEGVLDNLEANLDQDDRYDRVLRICREIGEELESLRGAKARQVLRELQELESMVAASGRSLPGTVTGAIKQHVDEGSFAAAEEIMGRVREGDVDPNALIQKGPVAPSLNDFFETLPGIFGVADNLGRLEQLVTTGDWCADHLGISRSDEGGERRAQTVRAWRMIQESPGDRYRKKWLPRLFEVLRFLGWQIPGDAVLTRQRADGRPFHWAHYRTSASIECPIPRFGSEAGGWLDIAIVWGKPDPESVAQWLKSSETLDSTRGVALFLMRPLDTAGRRALIHAIRRLRYSVLVVDVCLLVWLMTIEGQDRASAMFSATLAGCRDNPYAPDVAGAVPAEMFFGRTADVENLWRKDGPCIVYGGRQLGKSALLKRVQSRYHNPDHEQFVFYTSIGTNVADVWEQIRVRLVEHRILQRGGLAKNVAADIRAYLETHRSCRILFLLDECDDFIDYDADSDFAQISALRDLMTDTDRRFKVVLTGLHNVQRFQRRPNQPFAHFGQPLCIGPLAPRDALGLVNEPISALGYRFEPQSLIDRILAVTNRHPSLLQLVCKHLVDSLGSKTTYNRENTPPFVVTGDDIARIFNSVQLSSRMRERFDWTLDLDPRYRAIGYTFAELIYGTEVGDSRGLTVDEILDWVREYWPAAFAGADEEELQGLLDEMIGLGVLVGGPGEGYRLRNSNVRRLLGTIDQVRAELDRFHSRDFEPKAKTNFAHRRLAAGSVPASPLTVDQESYLFARSRGLGILAGSRALGMEWISESVDSMVESLRAHAAIGYHRFDASREGDFGEFVQRVYRSDASAHDGTYVFVPWFDGNAIVTVKDLENAATYIDGRLRSEKRWIRCLVAVDTSFGEIWHGSNASGEYEKRDVVGFRRLTVWNETGLTQWFNDAGKTPEEHYRPGLMIEATGGWPGLLYPLMRMIENGENVPVDLDTWIDSAAKDLDLHRYLGVERGTAEERIVGLFADMQGAMSVADTTELLGDLDVMEVEHCFRRLQRKAVIRRAAEGNFTLDRILGSRLGRIVLDS